LRFGRRPFPSRSETIHTGPADPYGGTGWLGSHFGVRTSTASINRPLPSRRSPAESPASVKFFLHLDDQLGLLQTLLQSAIFFTPNCSFSTSRGWIGFALRPRVSVLNQKGSRHPFAVARWSNGKELKTFSPQKSSHASPSPQTSAWRKIWSFVSTVNDDERLLRNLRIGD